MIGPSVRSKVRLSAATSSAREVSGRGAAETFTASAFSAVMTRAQLDPSAHAPWASTTLTSFIMAPPPVVLVRLGRRSCDGGRGTGAPLACGFRNNAKRDRQTSALLARASLPAVADPTKVG